MALCQEKKNINRPVPTNFPNLGGGIISKAIMRIKLLFRLFCAATCMTAGEPQRLDKMQIPYIPAQMLCLQSSKTIGKVKFRVEDLKTTPYAASNNYWIIYDLRFEGLLVRLLKRGSFFMESKSSSVLAASMYCLSSSMAIVR